MSGKRAAGLMRRRAAARAWHLARLAADLLLPPQCAVCRARLGRHGALCGACWRDLAFIEQPYCAVTGIPFAFDPGFAAVSVAAQADPPAYDRARAAVLFNDTARALIHGLKYRDRHDLAAIMGGLMARSGRTLCADGAVIVPVPLHRGRLWARRFNQSMLLAEAVGRAAERTVVPDCLARVRPTRQQVGLTVDQRRRNVAGAFAVAEAWRARLRNANIVLVDDVLTTGATIEGCARTLRRAGAARVDVLVFARVARVIEAPI